MKRIIKCISCSRPARVFGGHSYEVEMEYTEINTLTGEHKREDMKGRICRNCYLESGYKSRINLDEVGQQMERKGGGIKYGKTEKKR